MSQQSILLIFACVVFQTANTMDKPTDTLKAGSRLGQWVNFCFERSEQHRQQWVQGYNSHLQQGPVSHVKINNHEKKATLTDK